MNLEKLKYSKTIGGGIIKYEYNVLDNHSLQSFGKGRIGFLSDKILYNVVEVGENERYFYGKNIILSTEINKEEYFVFDKKAKKCNVYFSKEEIENIVGNIHLENTYFFLMKKTSKELLDKYILTNFILFSFYLCKEPLFFFSMNKITFLLLVSAIQISLIIFTYKIKINFSLKEFFKIFIISGIVYYLPVILLYVFFKIIY